MIKALLFDFFDVIRQDSFKAWMDNHGFTRNDPPGELSRALDTGAIKVDEFYEGLRKLTGQTLDELINEFKDNEAFDHALIDYISILKQDYKIGLLSNSESEYLRNILSDKELELLFDVIVISGEHGFAKPDAEMFEFALRELAVSADESVFIDDNLHYVQAASTLGIHGIHYGSLPQLKKDLEKIL